MTLNFSFLYYFILLHIMGNCFGSLYSCLCCQCNFMVFPAPNCSYQKASYGQFLQQFTNQSGQKVPYMCMPHQDSKLNIIFFHGNAEDIGYSINFLQPIKQKLKATVYAIQYPTYGLYQVNFPARISNRIKSDSLEFFQYLVRSKSSIVTRNNTIILGRSIGSGGAAYLASRKNIKNLVLISPFSTIPSVARDFVGCVGGIVKCHFDNIQQIQNYNGRLLVIHGKVDEVINFRHGQLVVEQFNKKNAGKSIFISPNYMSHNHFDFQKDILDPIEQFAKKIN